MVSIGAWRLSAVPRVLLWLNLAGVVLLISLEAKGGSLVSSKVHPLHVGQELRGCHVMATRTFPSWHIPPFSGSDTVPVFTQQGQRALGSWLFSTFPMCWKWKSHLPLLHLQLCFSGSVE